MIGGIGDMGSLMGMVSWMQQLTPQNMYGNLQPGQQGDPLAGMFNQGNAGVPGVDFDALRTNMMRLQEIQSSRDSRDQLIAERREKDLEEAKQAFFDENHYEFPDGPDGEPVVVPGRETLEQTRGRERYERRRLEAVQDARQANGNAAPEGSARSVLQRLMSDNQAMQAFLQEPGGQQRLQELSEAAKVEEEDAGVASRAEELLATYPPQLHDDVRAVQQQVTSIRAQTRAEIAATPEAQAVAQYQSMVEEWIAGQMGAVAAEREANWTPPSAQDFRQV